MVVIKEFIKFYKYNIFFLIIAYGAYILCAALREGTEGVGNKKRIFDLLSNADFFTLYDAGKRA